MPYFSVGDQVRVVNTRRDGRIGKITRIVPNLSRDEHFQSYLIEFNSDGEPISEYYLQFELLCPSVLNPATVPWSPDHYRGIS